jgi:hypothetical protein
VNRNIKQPVASFSSTILNSQEHPMIHEHYLRLISAQLEALLFLHTSFFQFHKPWTDLTDAEKEAVRTNVMTPVAEHFAWLTPDYLVEWVAQGTPGQIQSSRQMGFVWQDKKD